MPSCIEKVKDYPKDLNPSTFCIMMAYSGVALEISCGWACAFGATRMIGVAMATTLHAYIISMLPFASVMEWNVYCLWYGRCLFNHLMKVEDCGAKGSEPFDSRTLLCGGPPPHSPPDSLSSQNEVPTWLNCLTPRKLPPKHVVAVFNHCFLKVALVCSSNSC